MRGTESRNASCERSDLDGTLWVDELRRVEMVLCCSLDTGSKEWQYCVLFCLSQAASREI